MKMSLCLEGIQDRLTQRRLADNHRPFDIDQV